MVLGVSVCVCVCVCVCVGEVGAEDGERGGIISKCPLISKN